MADGAPGAARPGPLHVVARGADRPGPLVVLVHGSMDRSAGMARVVGALAGHHVVRYDRRGYGRSRPAGPGATLAGHVDDLVSVIATHRRGPDQPVVVVGHSYGGLVALAAAAWHRGLLAAVGSFEAPLPWLEWWPGSRTAGPATGDDRDPAAVVDAFMDRVLGPQRWAAVPAPTKRARRAEGPALVADMASVGPAAAPFDLAALPIPVVAGYGTRSGPHQVRGAQLLASVSGGEVVAIDGAPHGAHLTHPGEFAAFADRAVALATGG